MRTLLTIVVCQGFLALSAHGHGGGLDKCGGHNDRKAGEYHVHNVAKYCVCHPTAEQCKTKKK
jgi:hypothetical protein